MFNTTPFVAPGQPVGNPPEEDALNSTSSAAADLSQEYNLRFSHLADYRRRVWHILVTKYFQPLLGSDQAILDLGCGWGEFVNEVQARQKFAMDLNPDAPRYLAPDVKFLQQDAATEWSLPTASLDVIFTSNFFEHFPTKESLGRAVAEAYRCLKPGGRLVCLGPNLRYVGVAYWDFYDHHLPLTDQSLGELLQMREFRIEECLPRFLPFTMARGRLPPVWTVSVYLAVPLLWRLFGRRFLVVGRKPD